MPINSIEELADSDTYFPILRKSTAIYNLIMSSGISDFVKIREKIQKNGDKSYFTSFESAIKRVASEEPSVLLIEETSFRTARKLSCNLQLSKNGFLPATFAAVFPKNSPYKAHFDQAIERIVESGIILRLGKKYITYDDCYVTPSKLVESAAVSLPSFSSVIYLLFVGIFASLLSLFLESIIASNKPKTL